MTAHQVDASHFRHLLGRFVTGVAIVTVRLPDGRPAGMTANSVTSVSLDPPLVLACIAREAELHGPLVKSPGFVVNILASPQEALSRRFAASDIERFDGIGYRPSPGGHPVLDGVLAWFECAHHSTHPGGDHTVLLGRVVGGEATDGTPLVFFRGGYTDLAHG